MDTQISPQVRLLAIVGAVLAVFGGGFMFMMNRSAAAAEEPIVVSSALANPAKAPAAKKAVPAPAKKAATPKKAAPAPAPAPEPEPAPVVAENGLPIAVARALQRNEVVVVALYAPKGSVDALTVEEARMGAKAAGAGFVPVNVLDEAQGAAIARLLGMKEPPAVLVYQSPDTLAFQFEGFTDFRTIAQAAVDAGARGDA